MAAADPVIVRPVMVTVRPLPTFLPLNVPTALARLTIAVALSAATMPEMIAPLVSSVAVVPPSYALLLAVMPVMLKAAAVMLAVAVGCVSV